VGVRSGRDVQADRHVASRAESGREEPAEPSRRTGKQNPHHKSFDGLGRKPSRSTILSVCFPHLPVARSTRREEQVCVTSGHTALLVPPE
jgi:hypothetical protein